MEKTAFKRTILLTSFSQLSSDKQRDVHLHFCYHSNIHYFDSFLQNFHCHLDYQADLSPIYCSPMQFHLSIPIGNGQMDLKQMDLKQMEPKQMDLKLMELKQMELKHPLH